MKSHQSTAVKNKQPNKHATDRLDRFPGRGVGGGCGNKRPWGGGGRVRGLGEQALGKHFDGAVSRFIGVGGGQEGKRSERKEWGGGVEE